MQVASNVCSLSFISLSMSLAGVMMVNGESKDKAFKSSSCIQVF